MSRAIRLDYAGARHCVMNQGTDQTPLFASARDCVWFLDLLATVSEQLGVRVHAYALLENNYQLLLSAPRANLRVFMGALQSRFSRQLNRRRQRTGPLFRGRYRDRLVQDEAWWRHLLAVLHLSPVAAGRVSRPEDALWTSHRAYLGLDRRPPWLDTAEMFACFGGAEPLARYVEDVARGRERGPEGFDGARLWRPANNLVLPFPQPPAPIRSAEQALAEVGAVTGLSREAVVWAKRGPRGNRARLLAIWWLRAGAGLGTNAIAAKMRADPASVSRALKRAERDRGADLEAWKRALMAAGGRREAS